MLKRLLALLAAVLAPAVAAAQTAPAQMGITPTTLPEVLQVLDNTKTWVTIGNVDPRTHTFTPIGGGSSGSGGSGAISADGAINVTQPNIGMQPLTSSTLFDNAPLIPALMNAVSTVANLPGTTPSQHGGSSTVKFPAKAGQTNTIYYFTEPLENSRSAQINCGSGAAGTDVQAGVTLMFAPGVDGVRMESQAQTPDGGNAEGADITGCQITNLGYGIGYMANQTGNTFMTLGYMLGAYTPWGGLSAPPWAAGDGIIAVPSLNGQVDGLLAIQPGAYLSSVSGSGPGQILNFAPPFTGGWPGYNNLNGFLIERLPAYLGYQVTTQGPSTANATAAWTTAQNQVTATISGTMMAVSAVTGRVCVGSVVYGGSAFTNGVDPIGVVHTPYVTALSDGATSGCSNAVGNYTLSDPETVAASTAFVVGTAIPVTAGACAGSNGVPVGEGSQLFDTNFSPQKLVGTVSFCDPIANLAVLHYSTASASQGAADALLFESSIFTINGGGDPNIPLRRGDAIWNAAFPFGSVVFLPQANRISVLDNTGHNNVWATQSSTTNPLWEVPTGLNRTVNGSSHSNNIKGWPIGLKMGGITSVGLNVTGSVDTGNSILGGIIGRWVFGSNTGGSANFGNFYAGNRMVDVADLGQIGSFYSGDIYNSVDNAYSGMAVLQNCSASNASSFMGIYTAFYGSGTCEPVGVSPNSGLGFTATSGSSNSGSGASLWIGPLDQIPPDGWALSAGQFSGNGAWKFRSLASTTTQSISGTAGSNVLSFGGGGNRWMLEGLSVSDLTNPAAIPTGTKIQNISSAGAIFLSNSLTANITSGASGDTISVGSATGGLPINNLPCFNLASGLNPAFYTMYFDKFCGGAGTAPLAFGYNGFLDAWGYGVSTNATNPTLTFTSTDYKGYNPLTWGVVARYGVLLSNAQVTGTERLLDAGPTAPTVTQSSGVTATDPATTSNFSIGLSGCTGVTNPRTLIDATKGNTFILGVVPTGVGCTTTQPTITLSAAASSASIGSRDNLLAGATAIIAQDYFGATNLLIPVNTCAGVSPGPLTNASNAGAAIGTIVSCGNLPRVFMPLQSGFAVASGDTILATTRRQGDVQINTVGVPGGQGEWFDVSNLSATPINPSDPIALDVGGNAWQYNAIVSGGTKPTNSGTCAINTQVGGMSTGSFKANGACATNGTIILAMPSAANAPTGWRCGADDMTTPANSLKETAYTTSSVTFTAPSGLAASDQVAFGPCTGF